MVEVTGGGAEQITFKYDRRERKWLIYQDRAGVLPILLKPHKNGKIDIRTPEGFGNYRV